ncbi:Uncharacterised protein [Klebsiella pneumoniae]|nr:Uncharacterised protein [Klebsiella pneumoniae]SMA48825.1 Uncharacterised protein [Klebsiella pneumoniae]
MLNAMLRRSHITKVGSQLIVDLLANIISKLLT